MARVRRLELFLSQCTWCGAWTGKIGRWHLRFPFPVVFVLSLDVKRPGVERPVLARVATSHGICHVCAEHEMSAIAERRAARVEIVRIGHG